jgi:SAM-dependent methyltransferase
MPKKSNLKIVEAPKLLKLDFGCGKNKREGFLGVDSISFPGIDIVHDLTTPWPWDDDSVEEANASHFVEHLDAKQRIHFVNELYRVLIPGGKCQIITPHWASCRAYGDPTHQWPPVSEFWFYYLSREWRMGNEEKKIAANAPHTDAKFMEGGYNCDFEAAWGYSLHQLIIPRNQEYQQHAIQFWKEACSDTICTLTKKVVPNAGK